MKKLPTLFISLFLISLASIAFAVSPDMTFVYGKVFDISTGENVSGASVSVHCIETGDTRTATSDSEGNYKIPTLKCSVNNTIDVTVTKDNVEIGTGTGTVDECFEELSMCNAEVHAGIAEIDVVIPEFPITALPAVLSMLSFGLIRKRLF